ncbi:hypothetical protein M3Y96_00847000 [Aphelenchoides besseyi]|nr:hypothetical protein M3Y96_00847000 [Aphelenchoides besseyi]
MKRAIPADETGHSDQKRVRFGGVERQELTTKTVGKDADAEEFDVLGRRQSKPKSRKLPIDDVEDELVVSDKKHTLDSDEEDAKDEPKKLDVHTLHGQEKATIEYDDGIKIMAFNMNDEMEEGHYDDEGNFVFDKKKNEIHDQWLDNVNWDSVKQKAGSHWHKMNDEGDDTAEPTKIDAVEACERILKYITDDKQTASDVLKKLNSQKNLSAAEERKRRWAAKKNGVEYKNDHSEAANELTGAVDNLISLGHMDAYSMNREAIVKLNEDYEIEQERAKRAERMKKIAEAEALEKAKTEAAAATDSASLIKDLMSDEEMDESEVVEESANDVNTEEEI